MFKVFVLGSNSKGNCILLNIEDKRFLLDIGVDFRSFRSLNFAKINCLLISHEHCDHIKYLNEFLMINSHCDIILPKKLESTLIKNKQNQDFYEVIRFNVDHDCIENNAYIVLLKNELRKHSFCYLTDANTIPIDFVDQVIKHDINYIFIELNHDLKYTDLEISKNKRAITTHLNKHQVIDFLNKINTGSQKHVLLTHKSTSNTHESTYNFISNFKNMKICVANRNMEVKW